MIVRIMGEGQVDIADADMDGLNALDAELEEAIESGDEEVFRGKLAALLDRVRKEGRALPPDSLEPSAFILPPGDATMDEVRQMLRDDGLIPG